MPTIAGTPFRVANNSQAPVIDLADDSSSFDLEDNALARPPQYPAEQEDQHRVEEYQHSDGKKHLIIVVKTSFDSAPVVTFTRNQIKLAVNTPSLTEETVQAVVNQFSRVLDSDGIESTARKKKLMVFAFDDQINNSQWSYVINIPSDMALSTDHGSHVVIAKKCPNFNSSGERVLHYVTFIDIAVHNENAVSTNNNVIILD